MTSMMVRCAVLDDFQDVARRFADWSVLAGRVDLDVLHDHVDGDDGLVARLAGYAVLVVMRERTPLPAAVLDRLPDLRLIVTSGMRNASIDVAAARRNGVTVCGTASASEPPAELTWALILALVRSLPIETASLRSGGPWQQTVGGDLCGRRLGLIGLGKIGTKVAAVGRAFGMDVVGWSPNLTAERAEAAGATLAASLDDLLQTCDVTSVHLALGERSRGLIGARELALMPRTAYLVNTSRSAIVDEGALVDALRSGAIAGAGLDVFDTEPLPADHPLRVLPNVVATPHLGYVTARNYARYFSEAVEGIRAYLAGSPVRELA